jgi:DNA polymerase I
MGEEHAQGPGHDSRPLRRLPHVLLEPGEVHAATQKLLDYDNFVIDVETDHLRPQMNTLLWVGLGGPGQNYLIPCGHPKGLLITPAHKEKTPASLLYPPDDPRAKTPLGKPSMRMVEHMVPALYGPPPDQLSAREVLDIIRPLLFSDRGKIGHGVKFDLETIAKYYGEIPPGPYHDTLVLQHVLDENLAEKGLDYKLKTITIHRYRPDDPKRFYPRLGEEGIENFGLDEVARYLAKDLSYGWLLFQNYYPRLERYGLQAVYDLEMAVYRAVMEMEYHGFPVDISALDEVRAELVGRIREIEERAWRIAGGQFQLSNTGAKRWLMFGPAGTKKTAFETTPEGVCTRRPLKSQRLKVLSRTDKGVAQITQGILEHYADRNEFASLLLEWSGLEKLRGTFIGNPSDEDQKVEATGIHRFLHHRSNDLPTVHTSFKFHGTPTGRFSAELPNLQQIPRDSKIRNLFVAGPGHVLVVCDYDQIELRCVAYEACEPVMIRIFKQGRDIHSEAAAAMYQLDPHLITDRLRQVGKTANFATVYGAGEARVAAVAGVSVRKGAEFLARYYREFAAIEPWKAKVLREARNRRQIGIDPYVVIPPVGRLRRLRDLNSYVNEEKWRQQRAERQAINAKIQGFASYITKLAMIQLHQDLQPYPARMVVQVHDEIVLRVDERYVDEVVPLAVKAMTGIRNGDGLILGDVPLVVSAKVGYSWGDAKKGKALAVIPS